MSRPDPAAPPRFTGLTVRGWFRLVLAAIVVFVLAASVIIALVLARSRVVSSRLNDTIQPAEAQAYLLQLSLLQQQSSVRGYVITREPGFLSPYTSGLATEHRAAARLRELIGRDQPMAADLNRVEQAAAQWRATYAVPLIELGKSGAPAGAATTLLDGSEQAFSGLRSLFDTQNQHLADQVTRGSASLGRARAVTNWTFIILLLAFLVAAGALAVVLNYTVLHPLNRIRSSVRRVVAGDFEHRIAIAGPADLRAVATDIEAMRSRLVAAAEAARAAQEFAASQAADLDAQAAELIRSNAELEQFAYVASHDLQEPLRKVASFCQLLEKRYGDQLDERGRQYIDFAVDGAKRLQVLINDLLTFSRVGRGHEVRTEVPLSQPLDSAISALDAMIEDTGRGHRPAGRAAPGQRRRDPPGDAVAEPGQQRDQVRPGGRAAADHDHLRGGAGQHVADLRGGQRNWRRAGVLRQDFHHLPAAARPGRLSRDRYRAGAVQADRRISRRRDLARRGIFWRHPDLLYSSSPAAREAGPR